MPVLRVPKKGGLKRMFSSSYFCSKCSFKHRNEWRLPRYYELPDGALVLIATTHGWCFECGDVSCEIEHFEEAATRQKQISNVQARFAETSDELRQVRKPSLFVLLLGNAARAKENLGFERAEIESLRPRLRWSDSLDCVLLRRSVSDVGQRTSRFFLFPRCR